MNSFIENDGHYKFTIDNEYPVGTYPLSPFEEGEQDGLDSITRPDDVKVIHEKLAFHPGYLEGLISGARHAKMIPEDGNYGEEPMQ
ncbi:MAG TPA: hypothetical protein VH234_01575 [Candidatus Saccharimonadales bacterium]|jgi:hypothetical protein|nr:hypothetical protein [Candidatus Saccharimonadales bacterium]